MLPSGINASPISWQWFLSIPQKILNIPAFLLFWGGMERDQWHKLKMQLTGGFLEKDVLKNFTKFTWKHLIGLFSSYVTLKLPFFDPSTPITGFIKNDHETPVTLPHAWHRYPTLSFISHISLFRSWEKSKYTHPTMAHPPCF